jgi:predicted DsbA family dithiol-disulfide isomerase
VRVDIWSDVVCPWCYIGKRRFTFDAHRLVHLARERGVQERVLERLFEA